MPDKNQAIKEFKKLFGNSGFRKRMGNVGASRNAKQVCQNLMSIAQPLLAKRFIASPYNCEQKLVHLGQWEGAWALAQLHYDQLLKQEATTGKRAHKGHPLCNLSLVAQEINSPSLTRHYALLSSAGDIYWKHKDKNLKFGGLGPTILERFEAHTQHYAWRQQIRNALSKFNISKPLYLESLLASRWLPRHSSHIMSVAEVNSGTAKPFAEVLLDAVVKINKKLNVKQGTLFEAAAGLVISATPGFTVDSARKESHEQIDLVVYYTPEPWAPIGLMQGPGLIECKSSKKRVSCSELRDFGAKCLFRKVKFGIVVTRTGLTGTAGKIESPKAAELVRRQFLADGLTLLVVDISDLRNKSRELRGIQYELFSDYKELVFGSVA